MRLSVLALYSLLPLLLIAQGPAEPSPVFRLKVTPVSSIEAALPDKPFDAWLTDLFQPPKYEMNHCEAPGKEPEWCVIVTAVKGIQMVHLTFRVAANVAQNGSQDKQQKDLKQSAKVEFLAGNVGPSNPMMKMPTRFLRKLSDLQPQAHPTAP